MVLCIAELSESGGREVAQRLSARMATPLYDLDRNGDLPISGPGIVLDSCACHEASGEEVCRVLLHSSVGYRAGRLAQSRAVSTEDAERLILRQDRERALQFGMRTGRQWPDYSGCDLVIDMEKLGVAAAVELLVQFVALMTMRRRRKELATWSGTL